MFGLIPRAVWSRTLGPHLDDKGRMPVQHNCLLLERLDDPAPGSPAAGLPAPRLVLLETGTGNKLDPASAAIFDLEDRPDGSGPRSILDALHEADCRPEDIGAVVVSHLHFDHAGGLTRLPRAGETPDWTGPASGMAGKRPDHGVKLTFPSATVHTQAREWHDALNNTSVMTRTYFRDHLEPVRGLVRAAESPPPFAPGLVPLRDQAPAAPVERRATEILPGIRVFLVPGHTWGQQATLFTDEAGRTVVFTPDVMPTAWHVGQAYSLGYDVEPYTSMISRRWFLSEAADRGWTLLLDHEPGNPFRRAERTSSGWFDLHEAGDLGGGPIGGATGAHAPAV